MDKRYQVFVSSTYKDLQEERQLVTKTLIEMNCIPAGMELFPAIDEEQFEFIKKVIDDSDYYLLIIGGRYGSTNKQGISYTEKEYDYAIKIGLKVIALIHETPGNIPAAKSESEPDLKAKLEAFKENVRDGRLVKFWNNQNELPGLVSVSLNQTMRQHPARGWVRAPVTSNETLLGDINELRKENGELKSKLAKIEKTNSAYPIEGLAKMSESFMVKTTLYMPLGIGTQRTEQQIDLTWEEIFSIMAICLVSPQETTMLKTSFERNLAKQKQMGPGTCRIDDLCFLVICFQLKAYELITDQGGIVYRLTPKGERKMMDVLTVKSKEPRRISG